MLEMIMPYVVPFAGALALTLVLTPLVREMNRRLGMVDKPDPRRINKIPVPRGGGLALVVGVIVPYSVFVLLTGRPALQGVSDATFWKIGALSVTTALLGLADDKFSLPPKGKLLGQLAVAALVWFWAGLGFADMWPWLPAWLDCLLTMCWIVGAVNAFNLIDGLDGLAAGLAMIAAIGMAGALIFLGNPQAALFHFAFAGGLLGFLRYNYNPASVFLGDCGSMFIGFIVSVLPLCSHTPNSFLVSVGVPLLAMGVPIFDTALAILRRSIRHLVHWGEAAAEGEVMTADADHLHHRILRSVGLDQRKAAWMLYLLAMFCVAVGLVGMSLRSRSAGLWLFALTVALVVVFKDMARVELFDAGLLMSRFARASDVATRRRVARLAVPIYVVADLAVLVLAFLLVQRSLFGHVDRRSLVTVLPLRVTLVFVFLVAFRTYRTVWSRAMLSNYIRLALACAFGTVASSVIIYYIPSLLTVSVLAYTVSYALAALFGLVTVRVLRNVVRDLFYSLDCSRIVMRKDVSRIIVYGAGLRYRAFRRELVRSAAKNSRIIVGLIDDDMLLRGHFIGGVRVMGTLSDAPDVINKFNVDAVVLACEMTKEWMRVVEATLRPTGVKVSLFSLGERELWGSNGTAGGNDGRHDS